MSEWFCGANGRPRHGHCFLGKRILNGHVDPSPAEPNGSLVWMSM